MKLFDLQQACMMAIRFRTWVLLGFLVSLLASATASAVDLPTVDRAVVDLAQVFTAEEIEELSSSLHDYRQETGAQIAILTVRTTGELPIEDFSFRVAEAWAGGGAKRDDGLLLVFAIEDRATRLEVGYGLEDSIPDYLARRWVDAAIPSMRDARFGDAAKEIIETVFEHQRLSNAVGQYVEPLYQRPEPPLGGYAGIFLPLLFYLGIGAGLWWTRRRKKLAALSDDSGSRWRSFVLPSVVVWLGAPLVIALTFHDGAYFSVAMSSYWLAMVIIGVVIERIDPSEKATAFGWRTFCLLSFHIPFVLFPTGIILYLTKSVEYWAGGPRQPKLELYMAGSGVEVLALLLVVAVVTPFYFLTCWGLQLELTTTYSAESRRQKRESRKKMKAYRASKPPSSRSGTLPRSTRTTSSTTSSSSWPSTSRSSSASRTSSSSRASSSSRSSSSSSGSRSSSSSKSSNSRSYSGGGGSFGGGGATSRW